MTLADSGFLLAPSGLVKLRTLPGWLIFIAALLLAFALPDRTHAEVPVGLAGLLNPEGSRLFPQPLVFPRHPGKPDPRWKNFDWKYIDFNERAAQVRLYFYTDERWAAELAVPAIHEQIKYLQDVFRYSPSKRFSYILFNSHRDFRQANVFQIFEGVQGVTSTTEPTMAIPYWGEGEVFRHISTHEMVHQFQIQKIEDLTEFPPLEVQAQMPLWFIEGMAEYYSLGGVDPEARQFIRDMMIYPDEKRNYKITGLFEEGGYDFAHIYKLGQVKMDFFETEFGKGTIQRLLEVASGSLGNRQSLFPEVVAAHLKVSIEQLEQRWQQYVSKTYKTEADQLPQSFEQLEEVKAAGEYMDYYDVSPSGELVAIRELDPLSGETMITLLDQTRQYERLTVARDQQPDNLGLFFFELPSMTVSDRMISYFVSTSDGPELALRTISRGSSGAIELGREIRVPVHEKGILEGDSPAFSPDGSRLAFVGLSAKGWRNVYILDLSTLDATPSYKPITQGFYSWKTLTWGSDGIIGASDQTENQRYNLFRVDPTSGAVIRITRSERDQLAPDGNLARLAFQSQGSGSLQLHEMSRTKEVMLTRLKTAISLPKIRAGQIYGLGFRGGRFRLIRFPDRTFPTYATTSSFVPLGPGNLGSPWKLVTLKLDESQIMPYQAFRSSGIRLDGISGFFGSGNVGGIGAQVSDLMRNYSLSAELFVLGNIKLTNASLFATSYRGRSTITTGAYHIVQSRLDNVFPDDGFTRIFLHREYGALAAYQYPLTTFSYLDLELRLAGVTRSDFSDPTLEPEWERINPGTELMAAPMVRLGYDRILYEAYTGPLKGFGILLESDTSLFANRESLSERLRLDAAYYLQTWGRTVVAFQAVTGASWGGRFRNPFFVSSDDILRAYYFGDDRLRGNYLAAAKTEVRFPIGSLFGFPPLRGLAAYDYGSIFRHPRDAERNITSSITGGLTLNIPPININFLLSFPQKVAPGPMDKTVFHFTLRYLYL
jgi:hypothetical protein